MLGTGLFLVATGLANAATVTMKNQTVLRAGPGTTFSVIGHMPAGTKVEVTDFKGEWCQVDFNGITGFAAASDLGTARRIGNSPRSTAVSHRSIPGRSATRAASESSAHALTPSASPPAHP
jgi:uncharacterized protein YraI